jgi:hypothetical protein
LLNSLIVLGTGPRALVGGEVVPPSPELNGQEVGLLRGAPAALPPSGEIIALDDGERIWLCVRPRRAIGRAEAENRAAIG